MVAAWGGEGEQRAGRSGHAAEAGDPGSGSREDQPADASWRLMSELLGEKPAERHAKYVDLVVFECVEQPLEGPGQAGHPSRRR